MDAIKVLRYLAGEYRTQIEQCTEAVTSGNLKDFSDYRHTCGRILGLERALEVVLETLNRFERGEDQDD